MQGLKGVFNFYVSANIHVAFATYCLCRITMINFNLENQSIAFLVFFATILAYNFIRFVRIKDLTIVRSHFIQNNGRSLLVLNSISLIMVGLLLFSLSSNAILALIPFGVLTLFYALPLNLKMTSGLTLRGVVFLKLFLIGFIWAGVTVLLPVIDAQLALDKEVLIIFLQRFLLIVAITLPFDIRDLKYDKPEIKTLPQVLGVKKTKVLGLFLLMLFISLEMSDPLSQKLSFKEELFTAILALILLVRATEDQAKYYSSFFVESIPLVWYLLYLF